MAIATVSLGYAILGYTGGLTSSVVNIIEHYEYKTFIDDNLVVPLVSFLVIVLDNYTLT